MPLTEELTFKLGDSGVILNSDSSSTPFVDVLKVTGLDSPNFRSTERDHEGVDGGFMDAEFEKGRTIIIDGNVYEDSGIIESYLDSLKENYAPSRDLVPFYLKAPGVGERVLFVKPLGCRYDWDLSRRIGITPIQFSVYAEDPTIYTSELVDASIELGAQVFPGFGFNIEFSFGFGGTSSTTDGATVTNAGNKPSPAVFTIEGPVTNPQILNDTTSSLLKFNIELMTGETLVVDTYYRTVRLNGLTNRRGTLVNPDWFYLQPGDNFLRYRAESSAASTLTIQFRSAWR